MKKIAILLLLFSYCFCNDVYENTNCFNHVYELHENGNVKYGRLAEKHTINGILYKSNGYIRFYDNGQVKMGQLLKYCKLNGIFYKNGAIGIDFHKNGQIDRADLVINTKINNIIYKSNNYICFYKNGKVWFGILAEDTKIDGITYKSNTYIEFYKDGKVRFGTLAEDTKIDNIKWYSGEMLCFDFEGVIKKTNRHLKLTKNIEIDGIYYKSNTSIYLHENEKVKLGRLAENKIINNLIYHKNLDLNFDNNNKLIKVKLPYSINEKYINKYKIILNENGEIKSEIKFEELLKNKKINGKYYRDNNYISFHNNGNLKKGILLYNEKTNEFNYKNEVHYYENGKIRLLTLAKDTLINGTTYCENVQLIFNDNFEIIEIKTPDFFLNK